MDSPAPPESPICQTCDHKAHCGKKCPTPFGITYHCFSKKGREVDDCVCEHCRCPECVKALPADVRKFYEDD